MASKIPTSTQIVESAVINAPLAATWHAIKLNSFADFWTALESSKSDENTSAETEVTTFKFKDGTTQTIKLEEWSALEHKISYSIIASEPALTFTSVVSTITLKKVTSGASENATFVEWSANFSSDADAGVIEDARFKRKEALADLAKAVSKK
ncbi:hypothetical protein BDY24DRAFT_396647 [Mrakia frigida]|uniref:uncharacterized protein n=1 Tax=Mrakia frigida TaxID=29902 RepID=UPI003FCBFF45